MRFLILPTFIDGLDENGKPTSMNICPDNARKSIDGTRFIIHEEHLPVELKKYVRSAVDLEGTVTTDSQFDSKVLVTGARALMDRAAWSRKEE